uniref:Tetratricopeptide repeat protein n=1 Tax=Chromera velia CCMP2878 TaxID=1169474 RepID=A0A0G4F955_9ALVE|eukprot:Cvel_15675.t1-p1 / transcript=Cvel_15675.t1 / gene=Cvel_15675 / organism=Chromera_velia_CCMP2878 / gene_product=hypothetical protein / transcript_product=hypothetical protein / location=Cvel_scaffold1170:22474-24091(+) / protein_length=463 / sequence_SO=supercontig / SO=protein_coding / is_pseudo=false
MAVAGFQVTQIGLEKATNVDIRLRECLLQRLVYSLRCFSGLNGKTPAILANLPTCKDCSGDATRAILYLANSPLMRVRINNFVVVVNAQDPRLEGRNNVFHNLTVTELQAAGLNIPAQLDVMASEHTETEVELMFCSPFWLQKFYTNPLRILNPRNPSRFLCEECSGDDAFCCFGQSAKPQTCAYLRHVPVDPGSALEIKLKHKTRSALTAAGNPSPAPAASRLETARALLEQPADVARLSRCVEIAESAPQGPDRTQILTEAYTQLAGTALDQRNPRLALTMLERKQRMVRRTTAEDCWLMGRANQELGQVQKARDCFEAGTQLRTSAHQFICARELGDMCARGMLEAAEARNAYKRAGSLFTQNWPEATAQGALVFNNYADLLCDKFGHLDDAERLAKRAIELDDQNAYCHATLAEILAKKGGNRNLLRAWDSRRKAENLGGEDIRQNFQQNKWRALFQAA